MADISGYLTSEVVVDYADGLIERREALRRLALLGVGAAVAVPMLAACESNGKPAAPAPSGDVPTGLPTEAITFTGPRGTLQGAWAAAADPKGSVLVIHENRGLTDHIRSVAGRLAASGFSALAIDLLSEEGGAATFTDPAKATAALNAAAPGRFVADLRAAVDELLRRAPGRQVAAMGFCFGGGMTWQLLAAGEPRLGAAAPFYGPFPGGGDLSGSKGAAVLGIYAEKDARVNASRDAATQALEQAGLTHEIVTYPDADHAFFNDTGQRYAPQAAAQAYEKLIGWFTTHLR
ncbi:dienelactone hydrolase family protein [Dactylosporangium sp. AC04546]|uniref:dienelactone hydrolase family protein n=1 Tax=Dactylosporangium sp. AC04546 TaxID=2862460 RepID=UPI001EDDA8B2|nr:dienelactone hydrolase family protein [Dactylosporangium sp. AC04546]WVK86286.1 dienelactone hydrolase family protein [Dactylosporangium sp. AC04546]